MSGRALALSLLVAATVAAAKPGDTYRATVDWSRLPAGRAPWGAVAAVDVDRHGDIWAVERCGGTTCAGRLEQPILVFGPSGSFVKGLGAGLFAVPHGIAIDPAGNVWITDIGAAEGKGHQVLKLSPGGKVLLALGTAGVAGDGPDTLNGPSDVAIARNGDIFVADGHGGNTNARIVKFSRDGKFVKAWGRKGAGPGEFETPHGLAIDSRGRLFVADRGNSRIQIFDADGNVLAEWKQFGRPSGLHIDGNDILYVADSSSDEKRNPGFTRGIWIGSARDGSVRTFIPHPDPDPKSLAAEGVVADEAGRIYAAANNAPLVRYTRD